MLRHGKGPVYDDMFTFSKFLVWPRSQHVVFDKVFYTLFIENGNAFSSQALGTMPGVVLVWYPLVVETFFREEKMNAKGYFKPYDVQLHLKLGLKKLFSTAE